MKPFTMPAIVSDTREQLPYSFDGLGVEVVTRGLKTGDYSLDGFENRIAIERKRVEEMYSVAGRGRERFEREIERLAAMDYGCILIEGTIHDLAQGHHLSKVTPGTVINSLSSWSVRYRIPIWYAGNRSHGERLTLRLLQKFFKHRGGDDVLAA